MAREVVVIPVHGMGDTDRDFDQTLEDACGGVGASSIQ